MRVMSRKIGIISAILVMLLAFAGCAGMGNNNAGNRTGDTRDRIGNVEDRVGTPQGFQPDGNNVAKDRMLDNDVNDGDINDMAERPGGTGARMNMDSARQKAMRIESECEKIPGVDDAAVIISGDDAVVGCRTNQNISALRQRIESRVKQLEPSVKNVTVTNSSDILTEIRKLTNEITDGPDVNNLDARVRQLIEKITPDQR
jgi:YhcN/YlaJ family sporulation lipoprotein